MDPSGTDPGSDTGQLLATLGIPEDSIGVFPNQTAAWAAAADGAGVAPAVEHLVAQQVRRGELSLVDLPGLPMEATWYVTMLERQQRSAAASALRRFLSTPEAMHLMRSPTRRGAPLPVPPARLRDDLELTRRSPARVPPGWPTPARPGPGHAEAPGSPREPRAAPALPGSLGSPVRGHLSKSLFACCGAGPATRIM